MKSLKDSSDGPEARFGIFVKIFTSSKKKNKAAFYFRAEEWVLRLRQQKSPKKDSL